MGKLKNLVVVFDGNQPFRTGERITGKACFRLKGPGSAFIHYLNLFFLGICKVKWQIGSDDNKTSYKSQETYLAENIELLQGGIQLPAGDHQIPFNFRIPNDIPSSLSTSHGNITYLAMCQAKCFNSVVKSTINFNICNPVYIHLDSTAAELVNRPSLVQEMQKGYSCCGFITYKIDFNLTIMKSAYEPGDRVIIDGYVMNRSSYEVGGLAITLVQEITFFGTKHGKLRGKRKHKTYKSKVSKWKANRMNPGQKELFSATPTIKIPPLPETGCRFCSNIKISYFLLFSVSSAEAFPTKIRCPLREIFIGTKTDSFRAHIPESEIGRPELTQPSLPHPAPGHSSEDMEPPPPSYESVMANYFPPPHLTEVTTPDIEDMRVWTMESAERSGTQF